MGARTASSAPSPLVGEACKFFDHMADLIDPRFYYDDGRETVNLRFMKKAARGAVKETLKQHKKENKRAKLDPDTALTTIELQRSKQAAKQQQKQQLGAGGKAGGAAAAAGVQPPAAAAAGGKQQQQQRGGAAEPGPGSSAHQQQQQQNKGMQLNISAGRSRIRDA